MIKTVVFLLLVVLIGGPLFIWFGVYNIAATDKHWDITNELIKIVKERSIEVRAEDIIEPTNLSNPERIAKAAANYQEMCAACHLAPGINKSEINDGLYPKPPIFFKAAHGTHDNKDNFWVIKNGIKLTGMPAWGGSHSDDEIWSLVAFINKLNAMSSAEYKKLTSVKTGNHGHTGGHK
ncbi:hypothetical protein MNBD_GAMMA22-3015 [hydrothermal vent metagenome]|uniref:Cytochrome c domain-containing protein n=1 Tax=hydrothermal vent metagenome TaxID=652676 RepID=A0A3B0ZH56_9ZZZZ